MKVIICGASGSIGGEILTHLLLRKEISTIIALTRNPLPDLPAKVENIVIPDFGSWDSLGDETWARLLDAEALVWAIGTYTLNEEVNTRYPLACQRSFAERLSAPTAPQRTSKFRFILLSGTFVEQDQSRTLFFLPQQRRGKGVTEAKTIEMATEYADVWEAIVIRPGGVLVRKSLLNSVAAFVLGSILVRGEELGAFTADLAVNGTTETVIENSTIVERGRELLQDAEL